MVLSVNYALLNLERLLLTKCGYHQKINRIMFALEETYTAVSMHCVQIVLSRNRQLRAMGDVGQHKTEVNHNIKIKIRLIT